MSERLKFKAALRRIDRWKVDLFNPFLDDVLLKNNLGELERIVSYLFKTQGLGPRNLYLTTVTPNNERAVVAVYWAGGSVYSIMDELRLTKFQVHVSLEAVNVDCITRRYQTRTGFLHCGIPGSDQVLEKLSEVFKVPTKG